MGDIIFGNKEEFKDESRKIVINLSFDSKYDKQSKCKPEENSDDYADYEEVINVEQTKPDEQNNIPVEAVNDVKPLKNDTNTPEAILILLLNRDWFNECTTNAKVYNNTWRSKYVKALMKEFGIQIAKGWTGIRNRQDLIRAHMLGALHNAKVIEGHYTDIARMYLDRGVTPSENEVKRIAAYMGHPKGSDDSKQNPYIDWTLEYVENNS